MFWPYTICRPNTKTKINRTSGQTDTQTVSFFFLHVAIRNSLRSNKIVNEPQSGTITFGLLLRVFYIIHIFILEPSWNKKKKVTKKTQKKTPRAEPDSQKPRCQRDSSLSVRLPHFSGSYRMFLYLRMGVWIKITRKRKKHPLYE